MFSDLISEIFSSFTTVIGGLATGIKSAFNELIFDLPDGSGPLIYFIFAIAGVGLATGILYKIFGLIRARKG